jgi:hypothetical protein
VAIDWSGMTPEQQTALSGMYDSAGALQLKQIEQSYSLGQDQIKNSFKIAQMNSKNQQAATEATREYQRGQLAQAREQMEKIGIPQVEIQRYVAEKNYEIAKEELGIKHQNYALDVAKYGSQLESQPDSYFQARRFQAFEAPRLLGQDTSTASVYGGPTPQISTLGARLAGQDPYANAAATSGVGAAGADGVMGTADDRAKTVSSIVKASPPSPYDGLDAQDAATLKLMEAVYAKGGQGAARGSLERLQASGGMGFMNSAGTALGYDPNAYKAEYDAYAPKQGSGSLA